MEQNWLQAYIQLALRLDRACRTIAETPFVDYYYGPQEWRAAVEAEPELPVKDLLASARQLAETLPGQRFEPQRAAYLEKQVLALETMGRVLSGEPLTIQDMVQGCLDVPAEWIPEAPFEQAFAMYDQALPGRGSLQEKMHAWYQRNLLPAERSDLIAILLERALSEAHRRTLSIVELPEEEGFTLYLEHEKSYGAASWYLGGYRSRLELNLSRPVVLSGLLYLMCHEGYPGHHVESVMKEKRLLHERGYLEQSIAFIGPNLVISEGIASLSIEMIFTPGQAAEWAASQIYAQAGVPVDDVDLPLLFQAATLNRPDDLGGNVVLMLDEGRTEDEIIHYLMKYTLYPEEQLRPWVASLKSPLAQIYTFSYAKGYRLMEPLLDPSDPIAMFRRFLTEQVYPSGLEGMENGE